MVKIKTKKQLNLPQLIEWAWDNPELSKNKRFISENKENPGVKQYVIFNDFCYAEVENSYCYGPVDLFTVEVDEEITEDTVFELLLEVRDGGTFIPYYNESIKSQVNKIVKEYHAYIDGEFKLIWRDGKLVE